MRSQSKIVAAKQEFFHRVWHERHLVVEGMWESGEAPRPPEDIYRGRSKPPRTFVSGDLT